MIDLSGFISHLVSATIEEGYSWRLLPNTKDPHKNGHRQMVLLATLEQRDDYSVVEVITRRLYKLKNLEYKLSSISLSLMGNSSESDVVFNDIGVSLAILYMVEGASLTFDRTRNLTPIHDMLATATGVTVRFESPFGGEWSGNSSWSRTAYNYGELISKRQTNINEDQQRRIEGLAIKLMGSKSEAVKWLEEYKNCLGCPGWNIVKLQGLKEVEKFICFTDK